MLATVAKYLRLLGSLARYTLNRELAFRGNFLVKVSVEVLWLGDPARLLPDGLRPDQQRRRLGRAGQYFFFVGCFFALNGLIEMLFLDNCNEFAELVRTGDLDGLLLKPIDEQFLITLPADRLGHGPERLDGGRADGHRPGAERLGSSTWCAS